MARISRPSGGTGFHPAGDDAAAHGMVGKRTFVEAVGAAPSSGAAVQLRAAAAPLSDPDAVKAAAGRGTSGAARSLPYFGRIQQLFGRHDVSGVASHVGGPATEAAAAMGAQAFATGNQVAFAAAPDLHTAAHEAAHVVQQRGGVQLKGGVGEVGDPYERHADAVADRVVQGRSAEALLDAFAPTGAGTAPASTAVQGKFTLEPRSGGEPDEALDVDAVVDGVARALLGHAGWLENQDPGATQVLGELETLRPTVARMYQAATDYGRVAVDNEQVLLLLYYRLKLEQRGGEETAQEEMAAAEQKRQSEEAWQSYVEAIADVGDKAATPENTFRTILLGRGASAAYIIENGGVPTDATTLVIGLEQPWRKERGDKGVINHPHHMIDPQHRGGAIDDGGLAPRGEFSNRVDEVISRLPSSLDAEVTSVQKRGEGGSAHYRIETTAGPRFAQRVIAAMGIGNHKAPGNVSEESQAQRVDLEPVGGKEATSVPRIMNMDELQRHVASGELRPEHAPRGLVVVGPNAAIDVMSTGLRNDFPLSWVTGRGRPAFLKGTDNEFVEQEFDKAKQQGGAFEVIPWDYLGATASAEGVTVDYGVRADTRRRPVVEQRVEGHQDASFMVYGVGPDVEGMMERFPDVKSGAQALEPVYDLGMHFNADPTDIEAVRRSLGDEAKQQQIIEILGGLTPIERTPDRDPMKDQRLPSKLPTVVGVKATNQHPDDPTSLELVSGTAFRFAGQQKMTYRYVSMRMQELQAEAQAGFPEQAVLGTSPEYDGVLACVAKVCEAIVTLTETMLPLVVSIEDGKPTKKAEEASMTFLTGRYEVQQLITTLYAILDGVREKARARECEQLTRRVNGLNDRLPQLAAQLDELMSGSVSGSDQVSNQMNQTAKTLPSNVLLSDQLTTSRSSIEARQESMPSTVAQAVDFITHDHTVIAAHIAATYAQLPAPLANYVTARIVDDRRHLPLDEAPLPRPTGEVSKNTEFNLQQQQAFQEGWSTKLTQLASMF
jgi:hypothetical protein